uniref:Gap junction beta-2 protein n=1 Tax=Phallusia mammillata TaxID=59560 RepID=A0A6F9DCX3_9ASCI|nr:gap junction beta-2 protein [Phallusia mammillata]
MFLEDFSSVVAVEVTKYSTFLGQLWYILVFIFRLIVVVTIGGAVYGDEQSAFKCSTDVVGCSNICYNEFAKISHMRFWAFQLLAVATPTVFFHFYSLYMSGEIQKLKTSEDQLKLMEDGDGETLMGNEKDFRKMSKRKKSVGNVKVRRIYSGNELKEVLYTNKIHYAYYFSIIVRLAMEGIFIYLGYTIFKLMVPRDPTCESNPNSAMCAQNPLYFLWMKVPAMYKCTGPKGSDVFHACTMHLHDGGYVPCFVSRPFEKTVFLCYMGILSGICFLISALELVIVSMRRFWKTSRKPKNKHLFRGHPHQQRSESVFLRSSSHRTSQQVLRRKQLLSQSSCARSDREQVSFFPKYNKPGLIRTHLD